jgi:hypothetical protein
MSSDEGGVGISSGSVARRRSRSRVGGRRGRGVALVTTGAAGLAARAGAFKAFAFVALRADAFFVARARETDELEGFFALARLVGLLAGFPAPRLPARAFRALALRALATRRDGLAGPAFRARFFAPPRRVGFDFAITSVLSACLDRTS